MQQLQRDEEGGKMRVMGGRVASTVPSLPFPLPPFLTAVLHQLYVPDLSSPLGHSELLGVAAETEREREGEREQDHIATGP